MAETLREMAKRGQNSKDLQKQSQALREQAQKLLDNATPAQRKELERIAREMAKNGEGDHNQPRNNQPGTPNLPGMGNAPGKRASGPTQAPRPPRDLTGVPTDPVDARRTNSTSDGDRVIAEWDAPPKPGDAGKAAPLGVGEGVRRAAEGAERAIEQQNVPPQYTDLVRRVFKKYVERTAEKKEQK